RLATSEQRQALRAMYTTCGHPHCEVRFGACRIHHVDWWDHLGPTDLQNLLPLCDTHHHLVHEGGWRLTLKPDRTITLRRPDGTLAYEGDTTDRIPTRPSESEIPEHLRRAARPTDTDHPRMNGSTRRTNGTDDPRAGDPAERSASP
ncbi:MAG: HNH endonuclease signature motif containing protein, partial [Ilumatobacteraceae bacterium]